MMIMKSKIMMIIRIKKMMIIMVAMMIIITNSNNGRDDGYRDDANDNEVYNNDNSSGDNDGSNVAVRPKYTSNCSKLIHQYLQLKVEVYH